MQGTLFIAPFGARNKKEAVFEEILSVCPGNDFSQALYLAPNTSVLTDSKRRFFAFLKKTRNRSAYIPFQAFTIKQLAKHLHEITPPSPPLSLRGGRGELPASDVEPSVISERVRTLILCGILKDGNIGYARLLSDLLHKIRHYIPDKDLSQINEGIRQMIFEEKARDRAVKAIEILQTYENEMKGRGLVDTEDVLKGCISIINQSKNHSLPLTTYPLSLVIDGFYDPTPLELRVITALTERAENVFVLAEEASELHKHFQSSGIREKKLAGGVRRERIGFYSYPSTEDEIEAIAKTVKKRIIDGIEPGEISVTFPVLSKYLPMLKRIFRKYGIPLSIGEYDVTSSRPLIAIQEMLTCMEGDYPVKDFLSFLTSPSLPAISPLVREWALTYSYRAGIVKGRESWLSIKDTLLNTSGETLSDDERARFVDFQKEIKKIVNTIEEIRKCRDIISFVDAFESALEDFGFGRGETSPELSASITDRIAELRQFARLFQNGESPAFYMKHILQGLTGSDEDENGVRVLPYELAAGFETQDQFFGGLTEGDFPSRPGIDPVLPEKVKKELGMPYLEYYLGRQHLYFKRLLNCSAAEPYFSCPSADGDKLFLPSPFLDWEASLGTVLPDIFTEEDVLIREGEMRRTGKDANIFWRGEMFSGRETLGVLRQRIEKISRGYFSVTDIDNYRKCPLRFYVERVLGFAVAEPPKFEVEAMLWGSLAHKTMEHLFKGGDFDLEEMEARLFQCLTMSLKQFPIGEFWKKVAQEIFHDLLPRLKEQEKGMRLEGFKPYRVEEKIRAEIDGIRLKGKIDRVDKKSEVKVLRGTVILIDYKTGGVDDKSLQMPLYTAMWQSKFPETVEKTGYYSLKDGNVNWYPKKMTIDEFTENAVQQAADIVKAMKKGQFLSEPSRTAECRHCYHSALCEKD